MKFGEYKAIINNRIDGCRYKNKIQVEINCSFLYVMLKGVEGSDNNSMQYKSGTWPLLCFSRLKKKVIT